MVVWLGTGSDDRAGCCAWDAAFLKRQLLPAKQAAEEVTPANLANGSTYPSALGLFISHEQGVIRYYHSGEGLGF